MVVAIMCLAFCGKSKGQQLLNDSLKNVIAGSKVDTTQMRAKWLLGKHYFKTGNTEFFDVFRSGLEQANRVKSSRWKQEFTLYLGISHLVSGNGDSGIYYLNKCNSMKDAETTPEITYQIHFNLGQAFNYNGNTKEAARYLIESLKYVSEPFAPSKKASIYLSLSTLMAQLNDPGKAKEYCLLGIEGLKGADYPDKLAMLYSTLSGYYFGEGKKDSALISIQKAISIAKPLPNSQSLAYAYVNLIIYYTQSNLPDSAEYYFKIAKPMYDSGIRKDESYSFLVYQMAEIAFRKQDYKNAEQLYLEADSLSETLAFNVQKLQVKKSMADFYEATGNIKAALKTLKQYYYLKDSVESKENAALGRELEQKYSANEKQKQIELLQKEKEKEQVTRKAIMVVASLSILIGLILFFGFRNRGQMNKQLAEKNKIIEAERQRAFRSEQFKQQFLANMSHELRSPMNAIIGSVTLALKQEDVESSKKYLETAQRSSKNLLGIINDILDLSKIEAGKLVVEKIPFNIYQATQDVINALSLQLNKDKQTLIFENNFDKQLKVAGDPLRYMQILTNLVSNAIKFTPAGKVTVNILHDSAKETFQITVSDEGIGMSAEELKFLFRQYHQTETGIARKYGGTGLGLAITKQLVELMHGSINVTSEEGRGSDFKVMLKLPVTVEAERESDHENDHQYIKLLDGVSIFVVDDIEENRVITADLLNSILSNVSITTFSNGKELIDALKNVEENELRKLCILTDLDMPVMNGIDAVKLIRKELKLSVPVIALTASVFVGEEAEFKAMGFNGIVTKPFVTSVLIETMVEEMKKIRNNPVS